MSKRHGRRGPNEGQAPRSADGQSHGPRTNPAHGARPHGGGQQQNKGPGWLQLRDSVRRDLEVGLQSLSFLERFGEGLDAQRRLFVDFPRITEELRTGAMERLAGSLERLYANGQGALDLTRFLRDLPLALGHLASAELAARRQQLQAASAAAAKQATAKPAAAGETPAAANVIESSSPAQADTVAEEARDESAGDAQAAPSADASAAAHSDSEAHASVAEAANVSAPDASAATHVEAKPEAISPRVELRTRLLAAAPQLSKAAAAFHRNTATVRRAAGPRRAIGPWRSDREVLEQARTAIEFANKIYDAYAEAWADAPLAKSAGADMSAEMDRFLAWTQLSRYGEVARTQSPSQNSARAHEAAPGVKSDKAGGSTPPPPHEPAAAAAGDASAETVPAPEIEAAATEATPA